MKIINTIGWATPWLRRVIGYCAKELDFDLTDLRQAHFSLAHGSKFRGWADLAAWTIRVKINPLNEYPLKDRVQRGLPALRLADPLELLICVTAHEIGHLKYTLIPPDRRGRLENQERYAETMGRATLEDFRQRRESLLAKWGTPGPGPAAPRFVYRQRCPRCGHTYGPKARRPSGPMGCLKCHRDRAEWLASGVNLVVERVERAANEPSD